MKHLFLILSLAVIISCNSKQSKDDKSSQDTFNKNTLYQPKYDSIISKLREYSLATDAIPLLENGLKDLDDAKDLQNKIKLELSSIYLLDYNMDPSGQSNQSLTSAIKYFEEVIAFDSTNHFFSKVLDVKASKVDSIHTMWHKANNETEKYILVLEFTDDLCPKMYQKE